MSKARHLEIQILGDECAYFDGDLVGLMKLLAGCVEGLVTSCLSVRVETKTL